MEDFRGLLITLALAGLFALAIFSFGYGLQISNGANQTIIEDPAISSLNSSITSNLNSFSSGSDDYWNSTIDEQSNEQDPAGDLTAGSIFHSISTFGSFTFGMGSAMTRLLYRVGLTPTVLGTLFGILVIIAILTAWRLNKIGQ